MRIGKLNLNKVRGIFFALFLIAASFGSGFYFGAQNPGSSYPKVTLSRETPANRNLDFSLFWQVWDYLDTSYVDKTKLVQSNMVYGAIKGMVAAVGDPYTIFLTPRENEITSEDLEGNFEGIGIQVGFRGTQLAVISPLPGSPAEKEGLQGGDFIIGITDKERNVERGTVGISLPEAVQIIRGPAGSTISLTLLRDGQDEPFMVDIKREKIDVPSVTLSFVGENKDVAHIRLLKFGGETLAEWEKAVSEILTTPTVKGVIVDVRNNPGGYLQGAVDIGSEFLTTGDVVVIEERTGGRKDEFKVKRLGKLTNEKVVVLMNKGSASASEILAGALRDHKAIQLVGDTSFGKGTIQEREELEEGVALHVTTAKWLTPKGIWVNEKGLDPDVKIEDNPETIEDEQLQKAIELL